MGVSSSKCNEAELHPQDHLKDFPEPHLLAASDLAKQYTSISSWPLKTTTSPRVSSGLMKKTQACSSHPLNLHGKDLGSVASSTSLASTASTFTSSNTSEESSSLCLTPSFGALSVLSGNSDGKSSSSVHFAANRAATATRPTATNAKAKAKAKAVGASTSGDEAKTKATAQGPTVQPSLVVTLNPSILGLTQLEVLVINIADVTAVHQTWLMDGWGLHGSKAVKAATKAAAAGGLPPASPPLPSKPGTQKGKLCNRNLKTSKQEQPAKLPKVIGFDTEFVGDQLSLVQLCCGGRALLVRVPQQRLSKAIGTSSQRTVGGTAGGGSGAGGGAPKPGGGCDGDGKAPPPCKWPSVLEDHICSPTIPKAAAEAWQDALMMYAAFGIKLRNGLDLTVACPPSPDDQKRGCKKLPLFAIFQRFFPESRLAKDKTIDHTEWFVGTLTSQQVTYGALDAFVSYAAGVCVLRRGDNLPAAVNLNLPSPSELALATQWVVTNQYRESQKPRRTKHDYHSAVFQECKKAGLVLSVRMSRFKTRLRKGNFVEVLLVLNNRRIGGICTFQRGKQATISKLRWLGSPGAGTSLKASEVKLYQVQAIDMEEVRDTPEEALSKELLGQALCGNKALLPKGGLLPVGVFGGGTLQLANRKQAPLPTSRCNAAAFKAGAGVAQAVASAHSRVLQEIAHLHALAYVNNSQRDAIQAILCGNRAVQLVQGPPGSGKTTVISQVVSLWIRMIAPTLPPLPGATRKCEAMACVARSNVAAKNIALALLKKGMGPADFRLLVSLDYHFDWHEDQYRSDLARVLIVSDQLNSSDAARRFAGVKVFVTTVSMLSTSKFRDVALCGKELTRLMVDEASQIYIGELMLPLHQYGKHLKTLSLFGDDVQLPPFGSEWDGAQLQSPFDHLSLPQERAATRLRPQPNAYRVGPPLTPPRGVTAWENAASADGAHRIMLSTSYRLPPPLCHFISRELYGGELLSGRFSEGTSSRSIRWLDVEGREEACGGCSLRNAREAEEVVRLLRTEVHPSGRSWTVITGYDLQRTLLEKKLSIQFPSKSGKGSAEERSGGDRVYNIDSFQGREDDVVVTSLVRCGNSLGFMQDDRRVNVMLTRCTYQLVVVGRLALALAHRHTLIGRLAAHCVQHGLVERPPGTAASPNFTSIATP